MSWKEDVYIELLRYEELHEESPYFTLEEIYDFAVGSLSEKYPSNNHVRAKIRQVLQRLREDDHIVFVDNQGTYRFVDVDAEFKQEFGVEKRTVETTRYEAPQSVRVEALKRYNKACLLTGIDHAKLLDAAHILPRNKRPDIGRDPENVLVLNKLHHAAFDNNLFTVTPDHTIHVNPTISTQNSMLDELLLQKDGTTLTIPQTASINPEYLTERNSQFSWV